MRSSLGMVARIVATNVFLNSLFGYPNRMFFMPGRILKEVERRLLTFIAPLSWLKLGLLTKVKALYGTTCELVDLRASNISSIFATHERSLTVRFGVASSLSRWRRGPKRLQHPAVSWSAAFGFYTRTTQQTYAETLRTARQRRTALNKYSVLPNAPCLRNYRMA